MRTLALGVRIAFAGGRESTARMVLMAGGVAVGVVLLLLSLATLPAMQGRIDRLAWHRTSAASAPTAPDPALWLPVTDWYDGRQVIRIQVAALGPRPPVPPGLDRLPGPGEVAVSPELAELIRRVPDDQLRDRFPGQVTGTIGPDGLISPEELVAVVGRTPQQLRDTAGAYEIRGIEQPGDVIDLRGIIQVMIILVTVLMVGPVVVFVATVTRVGAARREQRFAAIRLAGATQGQTGVLAATETALAAIVGAGLGWGGFLALRAVATRQVTMDGTLFFADDLTAPAWQLALVLAGMPLVAVATTLVSLHRVRITPLGARRRRRPRPPQGWRLIPIAAGTLGIVLANRSVDDETAQLTALVLGVGSPLSILVGLVLAGPWACMWVSRGMARLSRRATTLIAAHRIASDPYTTFRAVGGVAVAVFAVTLGATETPDVDAGARPVLDPGVVAIETRGAPDAALTPLATADAVVARVRPGGQLVVRCADLARVSALTCPLPARLAAGSHPVDLPSTGYAEPEPGDQSLPIHAIYVPTDGSTAARERVRTAAAAAAPYALARTAPEWTYDPDWELDGAGNGLALVLAFVLLVAACSLTVAVVAGLMERRRPFALLRASGVRLGELRRIAMLETAVPLVVTVLGAMLTAMAIQYVINPDAWRLPGAGFFLALGGGVLAVLAVCTLTWPLMDVATRHHTMRFE
ncbi:ABC transporter permease [Phytohabitans rumicis]|uniref:ABC3 transporter permease C-terminal domain-containing protein n=1 Tax=Phytohabitans rumicis TaxID=1076125 RepID=A0A6V8LD79_9ACTN|nr:FtsX-like permease family protein [Phytohabitans rumicis]GFJ95182.1 hypothetical protein Prum_088240 [Phytohabitans rumicis]